MSAGGGSVCLLGGAGFLGSALRRRLAAEGRRVIVVGRSPTADLLEGERYVRAGAVATMAQELAGENVSELIDLAYATVPATSFADPVEDFSANLGATMRHLELARRLEVTRFVLVSSGGTVYGDAAAVPIPETALPAPLSPYGITKLACEHYAMMFRRTAGVPVVVLRPSNVYGAGQRPFRGQGLVATAMGAALSGAGLTIYGDGSQVRDYLHVDDFVAGCMAAMTRGREGEIYNLGSGEGTSVETLVGRIASLAEAEGITLRIDWRDGRPFDVARNVLSTDRLTAETGWRPRVALAEGLGQTWDWMKRQ